MSELKIDNLIDNLRDDAPVYPMWTIGQLKDWRDQHVTNQLKSTLSALLEKQQAYRTHDMNPPYPVAVPVEAIEKLLRELE